MSRYISLQVALKARDNGSSEHLFECDKIKMNQ
jgi:hypothetical protein|nr:MAG TPA: hypothetical protein [Caudoviricetes sp.]